MLSLFQRPAQILAIDFGSNAIRVLGGVQNKEGGIYVIGPGVSPSNGSVSKGIIQDVDSACQALHNALNTLYQKSGKFSPKLISVGINTPRAETLTKEGAIQLKHNEEITAGHMAQVFQIAQRELNKHEKELISPIDSSEWYVDNINVSQPLGMKANQLKIRLHVTLVPKVIKENIKNCIESISYLSNSVDYNFIYNPIATVLGALTPEDLELGALLIDFGKTTTNVAVFSERKLRYVATFDFGTIFMTRDISAIHKVTFDEANKLIYDYGISSELINNFAHFNTGLKTTNPYSTSPEEQWTNPVHLQSVLDGFNRNVPKKEIEGVIFARAHEIIQTLKQEIDNKKLTNTFLRGIVLAGGGAQLKNIDLLTSKIFNTNVRTARPQGINNIPQPIDNPEFATVVGILKHGFASYNAIQKGTILQQKKFFNQFWNIITFPIKSITSKGKGTNASNS